MARADAAGRPRRVRRATTAAVHLAPSASPNHRTNFIRNEFRTHLDMISAYRLRNRVQDGQIYFNDKNPTQTIRVKRRLGRRIMLWKKNKNEYPSRTNLQHSQRGRGKHFDNLKSWLGFSSAIHSLWELESFQVSTV